MSPLPCTAFYYPNPAAGPFHCLCPSLYAAATIRLFLLLLPAYPLSKDTLVILSLSIQGPPTRPRSLLCHRFCCKCRLMPTGQDSSPIKASVIPHNHGSTSILGKPAKAVTSAALISSAIAPKKPKITLGQFGYMMRAVIRGLRILHEQLFHWVLLTT
jgi:hypothetical protein